MKKGCIAVHLSKEPERLPVSEDVDTRGISSNIEDTNTGGSIETNQRGLERGSITEDMEMGKVEMGMQKDQVSDKNETAGDKGSSRSRNLGNPTTEAPRVTRASASDECTTNRGKIETSVLQLHATKYQPIPSCDQIRGSRSANQDKSATPRGAAIMEQINTFKSEEDAARWRGI